ncbi:MAG: hypothetical protein JO042_03795, partial [Sinobacteraceae bacterium]|nr:hypothetical protein [Nevskiaceae bacterium]
IGAGYDAKCDAANQRWVGQWHQNGYTAPLNLTRGVFQPVARIAGLDGDWRGSFADTNRPGPLVHIGEGATVARIGLPDQHVYGEILSDISRKDSHVRMAAKRIGATFEGELSKDGKQIKGSFSAFGMSMQLTLVRKPESPSP